jgi:hypothetical protein
MKTLKYKGQRMDVQARGTRKSEISRNRKSEISNQSTADDATQGRHSETATRRRDRIPHRSCHVTCTQRAHPRRRAVSALLHAQPQHGPDQGKKILGAYGLVVCHACNFDKFLKAHGRNAELGIWRCDHAVAALR